MCDYWTSAVVFCPLGLSDPFDMEVDAFRARGSRPECAICHLASLLFVSQHLLWTGEAK